MSEHTAWPCDDPAPTTRCKHGKDSCRLCGTNNETDVIHTKRTPNKREARRARRKGR